MMYLLTEQEHAQIVDAIELYHHVPEISEALAMLKAMKPVEPVAWQHEFIDDHARLSYTPALADFDRNDAIKVAPLYAKEQQ